MSAARWYAAVRESINAPDGEKNCGEEPVLPIKRPNAARAGLRVFGRRDHFIDPACLVGDDGIHIRDGG